MGNEGGGLNIETWTAQWHAEKKHKIMTNPLASLPLHHSQPAPHHRDHCCCCLHQLCRSCCHWYWCQIWNFLQHLPRSRQWSSRFHFHQRELWRFLLLGCTCNTRKWEHLGVRHNVGDVCVCGVCVCVLKRQHQPILAFKEACFVHSPCCVLCVCMSVCVLATHPFPLLVKTLLNLTMSPVLRGSVEVNTAWKATTVQQNYFLQAEDNSQMNNQQSQRVIFHIVSLMIQLYIRSLTTHMTTTEELLWHVLHWSNVIHVLFTLTHLPCQPWEHSS